MKTIDNKMLEKVADALNNDTHVGGRPVFSAKKNPKHMCMFSEKTLKEYYKEILKEMDHYDFTNTGDGSIITYYSNGLFNFNMRVINNQLINNFEKIDDNWQFKGWHLIDKNIEKRYPTLLKEKTTGAAMYANYWLNDVFNLGWWDNGFEEIPPIKDVLSWKPHWENFKKQNNK